MSGLISPDGHRYAALGEGKRVPRPFHFRWLIPAVCRVSPRRWVYMRTASLVALCVAAFAYGGGGWRGLTVAVLPVGLAGVWAINWRFPVLVDAPAMVFALASAASMHYGLWPLAVLFACAAGATKETAPVFAAAYAWSPLPLIGLVPVAVRWFWKTGPDPVTSGDAHEALLHPFRTAWEFHRDTLREPALWLAPWGVLLAGLAHPTAQVVSVCALAYGQCVAATDRVRLYQWAWPVLALATVDVVPSAWWFLLVVAHLANPAKGDGV